MKRNIFRRKSSLKKFFLRIRDKNLKKMGRSKKSLSGDEISVYAYEQRVHEKETFSKRQRFILRKFKNEHRKYICNQCSDLFFIHLQY